MLPMRDTVDPADAFFQRESIRRTLTDARPELDRRIVEGPSGALVIDLPAGGSIEIGRLRRHGITRWVVVTPSDEGAVVHEPTSLREYSRIVAEAVDRAA